MEHISGFDKKKKNPNFYKYRFISGVKRPCRQQNLKEKVNHVVQTFPRNSTAADTHPSAKCNYNALIGIQQVKLHIVIKRVMILYGVALLETMTTNMTGEVKYLPRRLSLASVLNKCP